MNTAHAVKFGRHHENGSMSRRSKLEFSFWVAFIWVRLHVVIILYWYRKDEFISSDKMF